MHVKIIAECGVNHNGSLSLAKRMIEKAALIGADYVKFQSFIALELAEKNLKKRIIKKRILVKMKANLKCFKNLKYQNDFILK